MQGKLGEGTGVALSEPTSGMDRERLRRIKAEKELKELRAKLERKPDAEEEEEPGSEEITKVRALENLYK